MTLPDRSNYVRPSSLDALEDCEGRALMEAHAVEQMPALGTLESAVALQGTWGHEVIAQTLTMIYHGPEGELPADKVELRMAGTMHRLEPWTQDGVRRCTAYGVALVEREREAGAEAMIQVEMHLSGKGVNIPRGGTADLVVVSTGAKRRAVVCDWKLGFLEQGHAADHLQLGTYAVMAWDKYQPDEAEIHLAQGRRQEFTSAIFTANAIEATRARIHRVVARANGPTPALRPTIKACRYCKALTTCRSVRERIMHAAEQLALFGADPADRVKLAEDMAIAARFIEEGKKLQKEWQAEARRHMEEVAL